MSRFTSRRMFLGASSAVLGGAALSGAGTLVVPRIARAESSPWDMVPQILGRISPPVFPNRTFDVRHYGATGDGKTDCTKAFRDAIVACSAAGGGRVLVPGKGTYRTGPIRLSSKVELHVAAGATIRFRTDAASYLPTVFTRWQGIECYNYSPFIYAFGQSNIAITGPGTIDGNAQEGPWFDFDPKRGPDWDRLQQMAVDGVPVSERQFGDGHFLKPNMIQLYRCRNIAIAGVTIRNPAMWAIHPVLCTNVTVRGVRVYSRGAMVDGCDPESCANVHITGCSFDTGDDGTVIKSGRDIDGRRIGVPSEDIVIEDCDYYGRWGAITIGSEMSGGVRNVFAQDCRIHAGSSYHSFHALYIKTNQRRGGVVDGIYVRRISGGPVDRGVLFVDMKYSLTGPGAGDVVYPTVRNIRVEEMTIDDSPYAVRVVGLPQSPLDGLHVARSSFTHIDQPAPDIRDARNVVFDRVTINGDPVEGFDDGGT
ncbi:glycoside hydrolase family 28 protein [Pendulispora albinea]|uniref:Glycoside hydrolase family 28 protein n=1 Tax=Pendulispora albinea TaxID=2741071 RepID=A0ABZ2LXF3_9BACT